MKDWDVTAELNMCADSVETVRVRANTARKAEQFAKEKMKKNGAFFVQIQSVKEAV